jgi:probable F420-dependent oxidoreductase
MTLDIRPVGTWTPSPIRDSPEFIEAAPELEQLGYGAIWLGSSPSGDLRLAQALLDATSGITVGTSIVNIWTQPADQVAESYHRVVTAHPGRFVLGLGISHGPTVGEAYVRPLEKLTNYLDELDAANPPVPASGRAIAALGPRSMEIARDRSLGSIPYLTTPEHTRAARRILGPDPLLGVEQKVVLETDPAAARAIARRRVRIYLELPNYVNSLIRLGFERADTEGEGSDRLVDALVAWGGADAVQARIHEHLEAGADHVAVQVLTAEGDRVPLREWRTLAGAVRELQAAR